MKSFITRLPWFFFCAWLVSACSAGSNTVASTGTVDEIPVATQPALLDTATPQPILEISETAQPIPKIERATPKPFPESCLMDEMRSFSNHEERYCLVFPFRFSKSSNSFGEKLIYGPPLDQGTDPIRALLTIATEPLPPGSDLDLVVDAFLRNYANSDIPSIERKPFELGGVQAEILQTGSGREGSRQIFTIYNDRLYHLKFTPLLKDTPKAKHDVEELFATVTQSFAFLDPPLYSAFDFQPQEEGIPDATIQAEQATARAIHNAAAQTIQAKPTWTPSSTPTPTVNSTHLPTLTPIQPSTPLGSGYLVLVSRSILGNQYQIENAWYMDEQNGRQRVEVYAGSVAGSGDDDTAQGAVIVRELQVTWQEGQPAMEASDLLEYLTRLKVGPVRIVDILSGEEGLLILHSPERFEFLFDIPSGDLYTNPVPPPARLEVKGEVQTSGVGSNCWLSSCADGGAIGTSSRPLRSRSPVSARLHLPVREPPVQLVLKIMKVAGPDWTSPEKGQVSWGLDRESDASYTLSLKRDQELSLSLDPGTYLLLVRAAWEEFGDTSYGFLLQVE